MGGDTLPLLNTGNKDTIQEMELVGSKLTLTDQRIFKSFLIESFTLPYWGGGMENKKYSWLRSHVQSIKVTKFC